MKVPKTRKEARRMYNKEAVVEFQIEDTQTWKVTMIGLAAQVLRDNKKIILQDLTGSNTKFTGLFAMVKKATYWLLDYSNAANGWAVRQVRDRVRFFTEDLGVGRFYWCHVFFFWFVVERVVEEADNDQVQEFRSRGGCKCGQRKSGVLD
jgi:hypothetical protein